MRPIADQLRWEEAIASSHKLSFVAVVLSSDGETTTETEIEIIDGTVSLDQQAAIRASCDVTLADELLVPTDAQSLLAPYGNEIRLEWGVVYPGGSVERVSLGVFGIEDVEVSDTGDGLQIRVSGLDRAQRFIRAKFEEPHQHAAGTNIVTAIEDMLSAVWDVPTDFAETTILTPTVLIAEEGEDRWEFCQGLATAIGAELYFDGDGICVLRPISSGSPVYSLAEGEGGVLVSASRSWTRQDAFNKVIVTGENSSEAAPVRGEVLDDDPASATYYYGTFGPVPEFRSSPYVSSEIQARDMASGILARQLGTTQSVSFGAITNPALEPGDVVQITRERSGISEPNVIDSLSIPLGVEGTMSGGTRATQVDASA